jgi:hypothetical protein
MCIPRYVVTQRKTTFTQFWVIYPGLGSTALMRPCTSYNTINLSCQSKSTSQSSYLIFMTFTSTVTSKISVKNSIEKFWLCFPRIALSLSHFIHYNPSKTRFYCVCTSCNFDRLQSRLPYRLKHWYFSLPLITAIF